MGEISGEVGVSFGICIGMSGTGIPNGDEVCVADWHGVLGVGEGVEIGVFDGGGGGGVLGRGVLVLGGRWRWSWEDLEWGRGFRRGGDRV